MVLAIILVARMSVNGLVAIPTASHHRTEDRRHTDHTITNIIIIAIHADACIPKRTTNALAIQPQAVWQSLCMQV